MEVELCSRLVFFRTGFDVQTNVGDFTLRSLALGFLAFAPDAIRFEVSQITLEKSSLTLTVIASFVTFSVQKSSGAMSEFLHLSLSSRLSNAVISYVRFALESILACRFSGALSASRSLATLANSRVRSCGSKHFSVGNLAVAPSALPRVRVVLVFWEHSCQSSA